MTLTTDKADRYRGCLLGLATGDAVGTTVEFQPRGTFTAVTDMVGGGPFDLNAGEWTDDTSMALCLAASLLHSHGCDATDQMNRYVNWWQHGYMSSNGVCFDIGNTTRQALMRYQQTADPFSGNPDPYAAGNGSIMRLAPVVLFYAPDETAVAHYSGESSRTTHAAAECVDACRYLGLVLLRTLNGGSKLDILADCAPHLLQSAKIKEIAAGSYVTKTIDYIRGSGYVVESLEAALWCFLTTDSFETAVLTATNLGDDADTTAAICGQVAGAYYGESGIPPRWLQKLVMADEIRTMADQLHATSPS